MTLTGRAAVAAVAGALVVAVFGTGIALLAVNAVLLAAISADLRPSPGAAHRTHRRRGRAPGE